MDYVRVGKNSAIKICEKSSVCPCHRLNQTLVDTQFLANTTSTWWRAGQASRARQSTKKTWIQVNPQADDHEPNAVPHPPGYTMCPSTTHESAGNRLREARRVGCKRAGPNRRNPYLTTTAKGSTTPTTLTLDMPAKHWTELSQRSLTIPTMYTANGNGQVARARRKAENEKMEIDFPCSISAQRCSQCLVRVQHHISQIQYPGNSQPLALEVAVAKRRQHKHKKKKWQWQTRVASATCGHLNNTHSRAPATRTNLNYAEGPRKTRFGVGNGKAKNFAENPTCVQKKKNYRNHLF